MLFIPKDLLIVDVVYFLRYDFFSVSVLYFDFVVLDIFIVFFGDVIV